MMDDAPPRKNRPVLTPDSIPALPRHVQLRFDKVRERWVILAPEKVLVPDDISVEVLQLCDRTRSIGQVVAVLAAKYAADPELIQTDCLTLLQDLADKGFLLSLPKAAP